MGEVLPFRRDDAARTESGTVPNLVRSAVDRDRNRPQSGPEPLWREAIGNQLREERLDRDERLVDVAGRAGVSAQYLSEVERGLKEPSSEVLAAVAGALGLRVSELASRAAVRQRRVPRSPVCLAA